MPSEIFRCSTGPDLNGPSCLAAASPAISWCGDSLRSAPLTTTAIRVLVTGGPALSRIAEVEAYQPPTSAAATAAATFGFNVALAANGGLVSASSTYSANYAATLRDRRQPAGPRCGQIRGPMRQRRSFPTGCRLISAARRRSTRSMSSAARVMARSIRRRR